LAGRFSGTRSQIGHIEGSARGEISHFGEVAIPGGRAGLVPSLRVITWHSPNNWEKSSEIPSVRIVEKIQYVNMANFCYMIWRYYIFVQLQLCW